MGDRSGTFIPEDRRPMGRPSCGCVDIIKMYLREVECGGLDQIAVAQDRDSWLTLVNVIMNLHFP
jgi:hypothetical protein